MAKAGIKSIYDSDFDSVRKFLDTIPSINAGGCGISTYAMYLWLKKMGLLNSDCGAIFLHYSYSADNFLTNKGTLEEGKGNLKTPEHVAILYKGIIYDSTYEINPDSYDYMLAVPLDKVEDFLVQALNGDDWNRRFDRPAAVKMIEETLQISFRSDMRRESKSWEVEKK